MTGSDGISVGLGIAKALGLVAAFAISWSFGGAMLMGVGLRGIELVESHTNDGVTSLIKTRSQSPCDNAGRLNHRLTKAATIAKAAAQATLITTVSCKFGTFVPLSKRVA